MTTVEDKENVGPATSSDRLSREPLSPSSAKKSRKGRSKSIGPGSLDEPEESKQSAKDRRKSSFAPITRSILSKNEESERAARRKSMMNRRVSFAPEATLHTWDIVEYAKDHTTSTESADSTRRASSFDRSSSSPAPGSDVPQEDNTELLSPETSQTGGNGKSKKPGSGILPMEYGHQDDCSLNGSSESEDESGSEEEDGAEESDDDTGTAMSLDVDEATVQSAAASDDSTGSSAGLEERLRMAAQTAGTRGPRYDEFGEEDSGEHSQSMEIASEEITNAFKPWAQRQPIEPYGSLGVDKENINPFSQEFQAVVEEKQQGSGADVDDDDDDDMSMDVTKAIGGILKGGKAALASSPVSEDDATMEFTQAVGKITGQKRRRSMNELGSPATSIPAAPPKRRRSSVARSSMGDESMDLTMAVGGIQSTGSPVKSERQRSLRNRRSSGVTSVQEDATMDFTQAVGGIKSTLNSAEAADEESFDGNEDLSMELTAVLGDIKAKQQSLSPEKSRPTTPQAPQSPVPTAANTTPKDQERFKDTPDMGAKQLLTPIFLKHLQHSTEKQSARKSKLSLSPARLTEEDANSASIAVEQAEGLVPGQPPLNEGISYPKLLSGNETKSPIRTPTSSPRRRSSRRGQAGEQQRQSMDIHFAAPEQSPTAAKQLRSSPTKGSTVTPEKLNVSNDAKDWTNSIKLMTTPRKEALKAATPKKQPVVKQLSPVKAITPKNRPTPRAKEPATTVPSPVRHLRQDLERINSDGLQIEKVGLQDFLTKASIRFMDLTTTKRRLTTAPTPSKQRTGQEDDQSVNFENGVVAAACTLPELELYQHACHELKRFTKEGKQTIAELESMTARDQPPLIQAYMHAGPERKLALDAQMRDMKTHARLQSKEIWYGARSRWTDELLTILQKTGVGLIEDDAVIEPLEQILEQVLPGLLDQRESLQQENEQLEKSVNAISPQEKEELESAREKLSNVNLQLEQKRRELDDLRKQVKEQDAAAEHLLESKEEFTAAIHEANRAREACRGVSLDEIAALKDAVKHLEDEFGWSITSASSSPATITLVYRSELQLFFHPRSFQPPASSNGEELPNGPIRLSYVADSQARPLTTTRRFFLQLLRASLQGLPQCTTKISDLLALVGQGWDTASAVAESERRLNLVAMTDARIVSDEHLAIESTVLLPKVRSKVRASFGLTATVGHDLRLSCVVQPGVVVVYGEQYNEKNMTEYLRGLVGDGSKGFDGWDSAMAAMKEKLIARGAKGARK